MDRGNILKLVITNSQEKIKADVFKSGSEISPLNGDRSTIELHGIDSFSTVDLGLNLNLLVSLSLSYCKLTSLPNFFNKVNNLRELILSHNNFTNVPEVIYSTLPKLEQLDLSYNQISVFECLPKCVYKLRILYLNNNSFINIPEFILKVCCLNLEEFCYSYNQISSLSSSRFLYGGPYRLRRIELKNCDIRPEDMMYLKYIRTLKEIDLSNQGIVNRNFVENNSLDGFFKGAIWHDLLQIIKLEDLGIADVPVDICQLTNLRELYLSRNHIMWLPDAMFLLKELIVLDVSKNCLISLPQCLTTLNKLEILKADENRISVIPDMSCLNIKYLDLYDNCLDECCLFNWSNLIEVDFDNNYFNTFDLPIKDYNVKKSALRQQFQPCYRTDTFKEKETTSCTDFDNGFYTSEEDEDHNSDCIGEFQPAFVEESWSSSLENVDNGCTASDNEWTGKELPIAKKKVNKSVVSPPSWMFIDIE